MNVKVPASLDQAISNLNGLGALLTAKQWERAAIVYAFTEQTHQGQRNDRTSRETGKFTPAEFARHGIAGLRDEETVKWLRDAWQDAVDDGQAVAVEPGDQVALPERDFPKHPRTRTAYDGFRAQIRQRPDAFRELVRDEPEIATMIAAQVVETPGLRTAIEAKLAEPIRDREVGVYERREPQRDYRDDLTRIVNLLIPLIRAIQRGEWQPSPADGLLLHAVGQLLDQAARPEAVPQDDLFTEIDRYLKEGVA